MKRHANSDGGKKKEKCSEGRVTAHSEGMGKKRKGGDEVKKWILKDRNVTAQCLSL